MQLTTRSRWKRVTNQQRQIKQLFIHLSTHRKKSDFSISYIHSLRGETVVQESLKANKYYGRYAKFLLNLKQSAARTLEMIKEL